MRLFQYLSSYTAIQTSKIVTGNFKLSKSSSKYLSAAFNINFLHENEKISEDFLVHSPANYSSAVLDPVDASVFDFIKRHGFNTKKDLARATGSSYYSVPSCPNLSVEQYTLTANLAATHLLVDDIFDRSESKLLYTQHIEMVHRMNRILGEYFRCNALPITCDIRDTYPKFVDICWMYFELGDSLLAYGKDLQYVYQGFDILLNGNVTQAIHGRPKSTEEYLERKSDNFGMTFYFEVNCSLSGESLSHEMRKSDWFKVFQNVTAAMCALGSDPMSIIFDLSEGVNNDNYSVILVQQGVSVKDAIKNTIIRYNQLFIESLVLISQMDKMNISESDLRYLRLYLNATRGALEFAPNNILYNPGKILKYQDIEDKDRVAKCVAEALCAIPCI